MQKEDYPPYSRLDGQAPQFLTEVNESVFVDRKTYRKNHYYKRRMGLLKRDAKNRKVH